MQLPRHLSFRFQKAPIYFVLKSMHPTQTAALQSRHWNAARKYQQVADPRPTPYCHVGIFLSRINKANIVFQRRSTMKLPESYTEHVILYRSQSIIRRVR